jgi:hypothetical protein
MLEMATVFSAETLVTICHNLQRHIAEDRNLGSLKRILRNTSINAKEQFKTYLRETISNALEHGSRNVFDTVYLQLERL